MLFLITVRGVTVLTPGVHSYCTYRTTGFNINRLREIFYTNFVAMDFNEDQGKEGKWREKSEL